MKLISRLNEDVVTTIRSTLSIVSYEQALEEIVYNSIDASATTIHITINTTNLAFDVRDNGISMGFEDLKLVGERNCTSKFSKTEELEHLHTFGFRGESLASVAAIGALELVCTPHLEDIELSQSQEQEEKENQDVEMRKHLKSYAKLMRFGHVDYIKELETAKEHPGTLVKVRDLFRFVPVRKQNINFANLRLSVRRRLEIIALSHPNISITLHDESKGQIFTTPMDHTVLSVFSMFYGEEKANIMEFVDSNSLSSQQLHQNPQQDFKLNGYLYLPTKKGHPNQSLQFIFINNRIVHNTKLHRLVNQLYKSFRGFHKVKQAEERTRVRKEVIDVHPMYILFLECPFTAYDRSYEPTSKTFLEFKNWLVPNNLFRDLLTRFLAKNRSDDMETIKAQHFQQNTSRWLDKSNLTDNGLAGFNESNEYEDDENNNNNSRENNYDTSDINNYDLEMNDDFLNVSQSEDQQEQDIQNENDQQQSQQNNEDYSTSIDIQPVSPSMLSQLPAEIKPLSDDSIFISSFRHSILVKKENERKPYNNDNNSNNSKEVIVIDLDGEEDAKQEIVKKDIDMSSDFEDSASQKSDSSHSSQTQSSHSSQTQSSQSSQTQLSQSSQVQSSQVHPSGHFKVKVEKIKNNVYSENSQTQSSQTPSSQSNSNDQSQQSQQSQKSQQSQQSLTSQYSQDSSGTPKVKNEPFYMNSPKRFTEVEETEDKLVETSLDEIIDVDTLDIKTIKKITTTTTTTTIISKPFQLTPPPPPPVKSEDQKQINHSNNNNYNFSPPASPSFDFDIGIADTNTTTTSSTFTSPTLNSRASITSPSSPKRLTSPSPKKKQRSKYFTSPDSDDNDRDISDSDNSKTKVVHSAHFDVVTTPITNNQPVISKFFTNTTPATQVPTPNLNVSPIKPIQTPVSPSLKQTQLSFQPTTGNIQQSPIKQTSPNRQIYFSPTQTVSPPKSILSQKNPSDKSNSNEELTTNDSEELEVELKHKSPTNRRLRFSNYERVHPFAEDDLAIKEEVKEGEDSVMSDLNTSTTSSNGNISYDIIDLDWEPDEEMKSVLDHDCEHTHDDQVIYTPYENYDDDESTDEEGEPHTTDQPLNVNSSALEPILPRDIPLHLRSSIIIAYEPPQDQTPSSSQTNSSSQSSTQSNSSTSSLSSSSINTLLNSIGNTQFTFRPPIDTEDGRMLSSYFKSNMDNSNNSDPEVDKLNEIRKQNRLKLQKERQQFGRKLFSESKVDNRLKREHIDNIEFITQLDKKFLLCQSEGLFFIMDQHAVSERINLETYTRAVPNFEVVPLNERWKLTPDELLLLAEYREEIEKYGFKWQLNKTTITVETVPKVCSQTITVGQLHEYLSMISDREVGPPPSFHRIRQSHACTRAVKFGYSLSKERCVNMLSDLAKCKDPFHCAHGRPSSVSMVNFGQIGIKFENYEKESLRPLTLKLMSKNIMKNYQHQQQQQQQQK